MIMSREVIHRTRKNFSDAADRYDRLAFIQNDLRRELVDQLPLKNGLSVLDIGCGSGHLLRELQKKCPDGLKVGVDFAKGMVLHSAQTDGVNSFLQADALQLPFSNGVFDVVVSSSAFQWVQDQVKAFREVRRVLKDGGIFHAVIFTRQTLEEFFECLGERDNCNTVGRLSSSSDIQEALAMSGLKVSECRVEKRQVVFNDVWSLLLWLKCVGANNLGPGYPLGRYRLEKIQQLYHSRYSREGGLQVTFEMAWIK